jgi:bifunctional enzyme CysN/CysC
MRGANARELAYELERRLFDLGYAAAVLDDEALGAAAGAAARALNRAGLICLCPLEQAVIAEAAGDLALQAEGLLADDALRLLREGKVIA